MPTRVEVRSPRERRLHPERRRGVDRRQGPRRVVRNPSLEGRRQVAERRCNERRATVERRRWFGARPHDEATGEHVRNALQLLMQLAGSPRLDEDELRDLAAAIDRLTRAVRESERGV